MYLVKGKITRPNTDCSFYTIADLAVADSVRDHWQTAYKDTGKCLFIEVTVSEDQLQMDTAQYWEDQASYESYKNDPVLTAELFSVRDAYWAEKGMTGVVISEESI
jgi:hypothetical protein